MTTPQTPASDASSGDAAIDAADDASEEVVLAPRFWVPLGVVGLGAASLLLWPLWSGVVWLALVVALLGMVLGLQALTLRLKFGRQTLVVSRRDVVIRSFPYADWIGWRIFWAPVPILFYFRERRSPHLVPMLFDGVALRQELERRLSGLEAAPKP